MSPPLPVGKLLIAYRVPPALLGPEMLAMCEGVKLAYCDWLLRMGLIGQRASLLQYEFLPTSSKAKAVASGDLPKQELGELS